MRGFLGSGAAFLLAALSLAQPAVAFTPVVQSGATVAVAPRLTFSASEMALAEAVADNPALASFYGGNSLKPIFQGDRGQVLREALRSVASDAPDHGLPAARYRPDQLSRAGQGLEAEVLYARALARYMRDVTGGMINPARADRQIHRKVRRPGIPGLMRGFAAATDPQAFLRDLGPRNPAYLSLQDALADRSALVPSGDLPDVPEAVWRVGMRGPGVLPLRDRLASIGFGADSADPRLYDEGLSRAVAQFQEAAGLRPDGVAGPNTIRRLNSGADGQTRSILVALERLRWMGGEDLDARMVWVNIPEFTARIIEDGHEVFRTRVVVGKTDADLRTPEFSDRMEYVVVNPRWNVPRSITVKEYLPRLKSNRYAVSHLDVVDGRGRTVSRDGIDFRRYTAANFPYRLRQKPSSSNALGLVKFIFPNPWNIYLHDTPTKHLFGNTVRAYSHGCVRVGDPFDLAYQLLSAQSSDPRGMFGRALNTGDERWLKLTPQVPVHLVYFTAFPDETGKIRFFSDVYGRDAAIWKQLKKAGLDLQPQND